ncbi:hypothetical protein GCM10027418_21860 [Mariniluteicoccus endophyticus]
MAIKNKLVALAGATVLSFGVTAGLALNSAEAAPVATMSTSQTSVLPVLKQGSKGEGVKVLQRFLKIKVDGSFGPDTLKAVKAFQKSKGLAQDGSVGPATWSKLVPVLQYGAKGDQVKVLQQTLNARGHKVSVDGSFGPATQSAVRAFQKSKGLVADGVVGPNTWRALMGASSGGPVTPPAPGQGGPDKRYAHPKKSGKYKNGQLPNNVLCTVPFSPKDRAACYMLPDLIAFNNAYRAKFGSNIPITGNNNAYRTLAVQEHYWRTLPRGQAARPGTSNHGWGLAIDIANVGGHGTAKYRWLNSNAGRFGFDDNVSHEAWHWEYER